MKKLLLLASLLYLSVFASGQNWIENLPAEKLEKGTLTFYEIQKAFNDYWDPYDLENGYYIKDGEKNKAPYWKQFKRWEWYWSNRIDPATGEFPETTAADEYAKWKTQNQRSNSRDGNWTSLGPYTSPGGYAGLGRLNCVTFHPQDTDTYYVGAASGGIWKTTDDGASWTPLGDSNEVLGVSDIILINTIAGPDILYIATGDRDGGAMWSLGGGQNNDNNSVGVLKSTDEGLTWNTTGLSFAPSQQERVNRLLKVPSNHDILYAATTDGVYKTTDGGTNWTRIDFLEFIDMEFKPGDVNTMYGATEGWSNTSIYKSTDGGNNWTQVANYTGRRTELAVSYDETGWVYAVVAANNGSLNGVYKSTNSGGSFSQVHGSSPNMLAWNCNGGDSGGQGGYDLVIAADPNDADVVYVGGVNSWKSTDGGNNFSIVNHWWDGSCATPVHADKHYYAFQNGTSTLFECNDGGLYRTSDGGSNWTHLSSGMAISQAYRIGVGQTNDDEVIIGLQDNGTKAYLNETWTDIIGGDGFECIVDYTDEDIQYGSLYYGEIHRTTDYWNNSTVITNSLPGSGWWITPYVMDPNDHQTLYVGYSEIYKSTNQGNSWTTISSFGGDDLRSLDVAPSNSSYIYAAEQDILYKTTNGGSSWTDITGTLPVSSNNITYLKVKYDDPETVWVTLGGYNSNGVYKTTNGGTTWTNISSGLPSIPIMSLIQNRQNTAEEEIYVGTDVGVWVKQGTDAWVPFKDGLPNVVVTELDIYYDDNDTSNTRIYAGTYGRGVWKSEMFVGSFIEADFAADTLSGPAPLTVVFSDSSTSSDPINTWAWDFGDGNVSTDQNPTHIYTDPGTYTVMLTATGNAGSDTETKTDYITVTYPAPTADFEGTPTSGVAPLDVTFTDMSIDSVNTWEWEFGDGDTSTLQNPVHTYDEPGLYSVELYVAGPGGEDSLTKTDYIQVDYPVPTADFEGTPTTGVAPLTVDFTDLSVDSVNTWEWNFGDGNVSTQENPQHIYVDPGSYTVELTVTGPGGTDTDTKTDYIIVDFPAPQADFIGDPTFGYFPLEVDFTDLSVGQIDEWYWYFGDGDMSTEENPSHIYNAAGTYSVKLKVIGLGGADSLTKEDYINILVGTDELKQSGLNIYPNPFGDYIMISSDWHIDRLALYNIDGGMMLFEDAFNENESVYRISTANLDAGVYYCKIMLDKDKIFVYKLIKN